MEYISAPWRGKYVRQAGRQKGCIFCRAARRDDDAASFVVHRGRHNFILLNKFPYTPGHLMIAPYRHLADFTRASDEAGGELAVLLRLSLRVMKRAYRPQGFNAGLNLGRSAGAGVVDHYHLHVVPRWPGDSNFMPLVGGTRVFIEDLDETYARLAPLFAKEAARGGRGKGR
jgi:ATP adenylyltransferase